MSRLATAFSRPVFRGLAAGDPLPYELAQLLRDAVKQDPCAEDQNGSTLAAVFDEAFRQLAATYRCEYVYKAQIVSKLIFGRHSPRTASAHLELPMGSAIADVLIVNGTTTVYEVKTDLDNFDRLDDQLGQYRSRAEFTNLVVSERRAVDAARLVPSWVGVLALRRTGALSTVRPPESMMASMRAADQFAMLRLEEARAAVARATGVEIDTPTALLQPLLREAFSALPARAANEAVVAALKHRSAAVRPLVEHPDFPGSLRALAYSQPLTPPARARVLTALGEYVQ